MIRLGRCGIYTLWNTPKPYKRTKECHLQQHGWNQTLILSEVSQKEKDKYYMISLISGISYTVQMNLSTEKKNRGLEEQTCAFQEGRGGSGMDWEFGVNGCKLLLLEWIGNEILLCTTGNYVQSLMMEHDNVRKKHVYIYV